MLLQPSTLALRALARARRSASVAAASFSSPSLQLLLLQRRRGLSSSSSSSSPTPPQQQQQEQPPPPGAAGGDGKKEEEEAPVSEKEAARQKKIAKIKEEIRRGYFYELGEVNRTNSKLFEADKELVPIDQARRFPAFEAESLLGVTHQFQTLLTQSPHQISLVAISFRDSGFRTLPDWIKPFQQEFGSLLHGGGGGNGGVRLFQVNLEDKTWLKLLKFMLVNGQKSSIERERHGQSFLRFGNTEEIREGLGIDNRMVGYVFLVDGKGRARWRGTGRPTEEEIGAMLRCAHELREEAQASLEYARGGKKVRYGKVKA